MDDLWLREAATQRLSELIRHQPRKLGHLLYLLLLPHCSSQKGQEWHQQFWVENTYELYLNPIQSSAWLRISEVYSLTLLNDQVSQHYSKVSSETTTLRASLQTIANAWYAFSFDPLGATSAPPLTASLAAGVPYYALNNVVDLLSRPLETEYVIWCFQETFGPGWADLQESTERDEKSFPFASVNNHWLLWSNRLIPRLADACRRDPEQLPVLHDALIDAGCENTYFLEHLQKEHTLAHVRMAEPVGFADCCWAIHMILQPKFRMTFT